jgi:peptidoglycan hydrolase CwlO-like protein
MESQITNHESRIKNPIFISALLLVLCSLFFAPCSFAAVQDEIIGRQQQIEEIQRQIDDYQKQIDANSSQARTLETEINALNAKIRQIELTIRSLELSINQTSDDIKDTESKISDAEDKISKHKDAISQYLKITYESDQETLTEILLSNDNLSDFFTAINNVRVNQEKLRVTINDIKGIKTELEDEQINLEEKKSDFEKSRNLEAIVRSSLSGTKSSKDKILKDTKGQEKKFQELVKKSQKDIEALRAQITYLAQNGVTAEEAIKFGNLAALRTGIRPAYLIAVLEVESGLGRNVGRCNRAEDPPSKHWENIMHTRDHKPFLSVTSQLDLDPNSTAVSCPQFVNGRQYGYGGAMGPAQFIPSTWVAYAAAISDILGRPANPWIIEDAFTAAAVKLSRGGATAQTRASEVAASKAYYSGKSNCSTAPCNSYANAIQRKAEEISKNL